MPLAFTLDALNEGAGLPAGVEVVVADGGSIDETAKVAKSSGARVVDSRLGRGQQLIAGATAAAGEWLLFLHADTRPGPGWMAAVRRFAAEPDNARRAAVFRLVLDDTAPAARWIERIAAWRGRRIGLPYGDQGLLIGRAFYDEIGGFRPIPLMEDVDLVRRIGRRRLVFLDVPAITSAARYRAGGYIVRPLRNLLCVSLFLLGLPPRLIVRLYG